MNLLEEILRTLTRLVEPYLSTVGMMVVATLLVLYGDNINKTIKRQINHYHFLLRTLLFILVCAFGYGLLLTWLAPLLSQFLGQIPRLYLGISVLGIVVLLGVLAERKRIL
ncbi:MAG: Protein of unknown function (DUF3392) [Idiomarinaceae bacterium HL-53]|nr:MAG: Protein of unknown function (DUF3392) [Idiomarinaceae bacterium HL-53]CUS49222.1 Protein of unknown function (DUF3392) [Idiomarinaceae bacterium HL-53]